MSYVIATSRPWYEGMARHLADSTGQEFGLITDPAELVAAHLDQWSPRYVFLPHWSYRVPADIYERYECVIFHMTDVPYGRGGSPLQNLIVRGHDSTCMSAIRCVEQMDAGPVYMKRALSLAGSAREVFDRAGTLIEEMILEIIRVNPDPVPQVGEPVLFQRRTPRDGNLELAGTLREAYDYIRMLDADGYPSAFLETPTLRFEFDQASFDGEELVTRVQVKRRDPNDA